MKMCEEGPQIQIENAVLFTSQEREKCGQEVDLKQRFHQLYNYRKKCWQSERCDKKCIKIPFVIAPILG